MQRFATVTGTEDVLPDDWPYFDFVISRAREVAELFGYRRIETPTLGQTALFSRTSGEETDVIKEMYSFRDRDGDELSLRPEGTAPTVRAYLQHGMDRLPQPVKLWYVERMHRRERKQRGRLREHRQFGCEALGVSDAYVDVEMIALVDEFLRRLGLRNVTLHLNSIGDPECRPQYVRVLVDYLTQHESSLAPLDRERVARNPLRTLDSKEEASQAVLNGAPKFLDCLCDGCRAHWERLRHGLDLLGIQYEIDHRLVRGMDYYTRTAFEFMPASAERQATLVAGGRYDVLSQAMGGPPLPGIGFGAGVERLVLAMKDAQVDVPTSARPDLYFVFRGDEAQDLAMRLAEELRRLDVSCDMGFGSQSLKAQLRRANAVGARYAAIIGEDELASGLITVRSLDDHTQQAVSEDELFRAVSSGSPEPRNDPARA